MKAKIFNRQLAIPGFAISIIVGMLMLATFSWSALAQTAVSAAPAQTVASGVPAGTPLPPSLRKTFNHLNTGFPLKAAHLSVACETCHIGGTFKGTPKDCAGCHTVGRLVAATPKTQNHIPTTKACEACHGNAASFQTAVMDHTGLTEPCAVCHNGNYSTIIKSVPSDTVHNNNNAPCDTCHKNTFTFLGSRYDHTNAISDCANCHNNVTAPGKPAAHIATSAPCEICHTATVTPGWPLPTSFLGASFDHSTIGSTACSSCHGPMPGVVSKPATHIPTTAACDTCHTSTVTPGGFATWTMNHTGITTGCASCHTGATLGSAATVVKGKPATHIATTAACETCHSAISTGIGGFAAPNWTMSHTGITTGCASCHGGQTFPTGVTPVGQISGHVLTTAACENCHTSTATPGGFATWKMNHTGITTGCATCHLASGDRTVGTAVVKGIPIGHIVVTAACESCHTTTTLGGFATWTMNHAANGNTAGCATCHASGSTFYNAPTLVTLSTTTHIPVTGIACETCHSSTNTSTGGFATSALPMGIPGHTAALAVTPLCATCHGATATFTGVRIQSASHITYTPGTDCVSCHTQTTTSGYTSFLNAAFNHSAIGGAACSSCHGGTVAGIKTKPANHILTTQDCKVCHTSPAGVAPVNGFNLPNPAMDHTGITTGCASCHNGSNVGTTVTTIVLGKPATHIATSLACETCHTTSPTGVGPIGSFSSWTMNHTGITLGCASCHLQSGDSTVGNALIKGKPAAHIATTLACESCHSITSTSTGGFAAPNWTMNHTANGNTSNCASCHTGATVGTTVVVGKSTHPTHITTSAACESCHSSNSTGPGGFAAPNWTMNHAILPSLPPSPATRCDSCHNGQTFYGVTIANSTSFSSPHPATIPIAGADCGTCHGSVTSFLASTTYSHVGVAAGSCSSCHGTPPTLTPVGLSKPAGHLVTALSCDNSGCHTSGLYTPGSFKMATYAHTTPAAAVLGSHQCGTSCHNNSATVTTTGATEPTTHIPTTINGPACDACHINTTSFLGAVMNHTGITTGCATCHAASYTGVVVKPGAHVATAIACESCHSPSSTSTGGFAAPNWTMNHTANGNTSSCETCHTGATQVNAVVMGKPANHITTATPCVTCHANTSPGGFAVPNPAMNHTGITTGCASCHNGTNVGTTVTTIVLGKPATHIPTTAACETCHTNTTTPGGFATWTMNHTGITSGCATCHANGSTFYNVPSLVTLSLTSHVPVGALACESCHSSASTGTGTFATAWTMGTTGHALVNATPCATCHNDGTPYTGVVKQNSIIAHVATTAPCDTCHTSSNTSGYTTFLGATGAHTTNPVPTLGPTCSGCHGTTIVATGPGGGKGMIANHIPIGGRDCSACHTYTTFVSPPIPTVHTAISGTACSTCHNTGLTYVGMAGGGLVVTKPATGHIVTAIACESCHTSTVSPGGFTTWTMNHSANGNTSGCATCHANGRSFTNNGGTPLVTLSLTTHVPVGATACETCHSSSATTVGSFSTAWTMGTTGHTAALAVTPLCGTCHGTGGSAYTGVKIIDSAHIPSSYYPAQDCGTNCHTASSTSNYSIGGFLLLNMTGLPGHTGITTNCAPCHNNIIAKGTASFSGHVAIGASDCVTCHTPANTASYTTFLGSTAGHTAASAPGQCATSGCHVSGGAGRIFTAQHIPSSSPGATLGVSAAGQCDGCHTTSYASMSFTAYASATIHTASNWSAALKCSQCHNGSYTAEGTVGAQAKTLVSHIPTTITDAAGLDCNACHYYTGTTPTISATGFAGSKTTAETMDHNGAKGGAPYYCVTCHLKGVTYLSGAQLVSHNGASTSKDCSSSGCHKPLGSNSSFGNYTR